MTVFEFEARMSLHAALRWLPDPDPGVSDNDTIVYRLSNAGLLIVEFQDGKVKAVGLIGD